MTIHETLKQYWGHEHFRPLQEEIIRSVLDGKDTLALLPTGGGKSICFQVPALMREGICVVISPLIALMKDQVENLNKRGIKAKAIYSGMSYREINYTLDNCIHGDVRFLYLSPERLKSELALTRIAQMPVNLLAVDEAHCISQWGYDFRPEYLQIAEVRKFLPRVPIIALTATATPEVVKDIQQQLQFPRSNVFIKSFERGNLSYVVNRSEDKDQRMLHILSKVPGTALVYVRNRRKTQELSQFLIRNRERADYYHAGLPHEVRSKKQDSWVKGNIRVMVCTNAFGMGIDKPDVRVVVHYEMPESLESYYQEAGRAGRDEHRSYCVLLYNKADELDAYSKHVQNFPPEEDIRRVHSALCSYYAIPAGTNPERSFNFDISDFCKKFGLNALLVHPSLKIMEQCDLISLSESFYEPSKLQFLLNHEELYKFQVEQPAYDNFIKLLLRSYGGSFDQYVTISEKLLAQRSKHEAVLIITYLQKLHNLQVLDYQPQKDAPQLTFVGARGVTAELSFSKALLKKRKETALQKLDAMAAYANNVNVCRSKKLVAYFDEFGTNDCGICDICMEQKRVNMTALQFEDVVNKVLKLSKDKPVSVETLATTISEEKLLAVVRYLLDNDKLQYNKSGLLEWKK